MNTGCWFLTTCLCLLLSLQIHAEESIAGIPDHIFSGLLRDWSVAMGNDSFIYSADERYRKHDDFRTATFSGYARLGSPGKQYIAAIDYSVLTDKSANRRSDEISLSIGRQWSPKKHQQLECFYGLGLRISDDFSGQSLQNALHTITSGIDVEMPYDQSGEMFFIYARAQYIKSYSERLDYEVLVSALAGAIEDESVLLHGNIMLRNNYTISDNSSIAISLRWRDHAGESINRVSDEVLKREDAWWIGAGYQRGNFAVYVEHHLEESRTQTMISYAVPLP